MSKKKAYPIVEILWIDAEADPAWKTEFEVLAETTGNPVVTVGFLIRKPTSKFPMYLVAATATMDEETHVNNTMKIPKHWVKSVNILQEEYVLWQQNAPTVL